MNQLPTARQVEIAALLVEGRSIQAISRSTAAAKGTVLKLLKVLGAACRGYQDVALRNLTCGRVCCRAVWAVMGRVGEGGVDRQARTASEDLWTWSAVCLETKLIPSWRVAPRDPRSALTFLQDTASRLRNSVQLTADEGSDHLTLTESDRASFDYSLLRKLYGPERATDAFNRRSANLEKAIGLHFMHYNFVRIDGQLGMTPAMAAEVSDHPWSIEEIVRLLGWSPDWSPAVRVVRRVPSTAS